MKIIPTVVLLFLFLAGNLINNTQKPDTGQFDSLLMKGHTAEMYEYRYHERRDEYEFMISDTINSQGDYEFPYLWKAIQGDFILRAEIVLENPGTAALQAGWIIGNTLLATSESIEASINGDGTAVVVSEEQRVTSHLEESDTYVVQIRREGDHFTLKSAPFGKILQHVETIQANLDNEVFAGIFVTSDTPRNQRVRFRNVRFVKPHSAFSQQKNNYLGSRIEVIDVGTTQRTVLYENEHSIQAPNWTPDGETLIYNSNGYLFNYHLRNGDISILNTGFANRNNNDHVISFDGEMLAISHHNPEYGGESTIYVLPLEGSDYPKQVTKSGLGASYLHGISPDNQTVLFTGLRNGVFDIYAADVETMEETQLTNTPGLDDGSEYTPDGEYILFNSNRTGTMQIWRMKADGSEQTQLTFDEETHDWFPHISPDGNWIVFLSYGLDVDSGDHPFYKEVMLQIMPAEGGEPEIIAYLYGGQGTINVPSWSPDSKRVAFVSNSGRF